MLRAGRRRSRWLREAPLGGRRSGAWGVFGWLVCGDEGGGSRGKAAAQPFAGEKKKKNLSLGGDMATGWRRKRMKVGGWRLDSFFRPGEEENFRFFRVFFPLCCLPPKLQNRPPSPLSFQPIFIGKSLFKPPNWSLNFFFFVNFGFSCFFLYF